MLSIIVVTIDRIHLVERLFLSLEQQTCKDFEVLFMHAAGVSSEDATALCRRFPDLSIRAFPTADTCLSRSRNAALAHVKGGFFCIADDDCVYDPDTVARALEAFRRHPEAAALTGVPVGLDDALPTSVRQGHVVRGLRKLFQDCPSYVHFYRSDVLAAVKGFDEDLGLGSGTPWQSGEETDFLLRVARAGFTVRHAPEVVVRHPRLNMRELSLERVRGYAAGRMRLLRKHRFGRPFVLVNILYPLVVAPWECLVAFRHILRYRWTMFRARLDNLRG